MKNLNIKTYLRSVGRNKIFTSITLFGFAVSMMFVILIGVYIVKESSVDKFHSNVENIYRLSAEKYSGFAPPVADYLKDKYPDIINSTRTFVQSSIITKGLDEKVKINFLLADASFFSMFSFDLLVGDVSNVLSKPNSIVLSESYVKKHFGNESPIGKVLKIGIEYTVTGIMKDFPDNTHFRKFDAVTDFVSLAKLWNYPSLLTKHNNNSFGLYLMLKENSDLPLRVDDMYKELASVNWMFKNERVKKFRLESLTDVYFSESFSQGINRNSRSLITVLTTIVILILVLSIINYINLTIAQSASRSKEGAIRKLIGGTRKGLIIQYLFESILLCSFSFIVAIGLSLSAEPTFNQLLKTDIHLVDRFSSIFLVWFLLAAIVIGFVSGIVPATIVSKIKPLDIVKGTLKRRSKSIYSKVLITFQYVVVIILLMASITVLKQTNCLKNRDLGFTANNVIEIENGIGKEKLLVFKDKLMAMANVEEVSIADGTILNGGNNNSFTYKGKNLSFQIFKVDTSFFNIFEIDVKRTGVAYSDKMIWLNKSGVEALELEGEINEVSLFGEKLPIYGIVKDFNYNGLDNPVSPLVLAPLHKSEYPRVLLVKLANKNFKQTISNIKEAYSSVGEGIPINITFYDENLKLWYEKEERLSTIIVWFTILSILISVLGILAMTIFYIQQSRKEIGVRLVNGATQSQIIYLINWNFLKWVILAFIIATPIAYYALNDWLSNFVYKTELSWWVFVVSGVVAFVIAFLIITLQSLYAVAKNPVDSLKYE